MRAVVGCAFAMGLLTSNDAGPGQGATACAIAAMRSEAGDELRRRRGR
jgi:hypothetical protein